jgi:hypothetical protein
VSDWGLTTRVRAVVTLGSGGFYPGHLHLLNGVHAGVPESPLEMLNRPEAFFPLTLDDGSVSLLSKAQVAVVSPEWPLEGLELLDLPAKRAKLRVTLASGEALEGNVTIPARIGRERPIDYLNASGPFFELEVGSAPRLVHAAWVSTIQPLE